MVVVFWTVKKKQQWDHKQQWVSWNVSPELAFKLQSHIKTKNWKIYFTLPFIAVYRFDSKASKICVMRIAIQTL